MALFGKDWRPVFDTQIFSLYRQHLTGKDFGKMSLSILVLYELVARPLRPKLSQSPGEMKNKNICPRINAKVREKKRREKSK